MTDRLRLVAMLAAITSLGPFAMQSLAPALPVVAVSMAITLEEAQALLSLSVLAIGVATLLLGPLSDYFGRRPVALAAMSVAIVASLAVAFAPTIETAMAARFVQTGACGAGMVLSRAIARDRFGQLGAGQVIAQMTAVMVLVPMAAPAVGGVITAAFGWRAIFLFTAGLAALVLLWASLGLRESIVHRAPTLGLVEIGRSFAAVAARRRFWAYCIVGTASLSSFLFFVGTAPHVAAVGFGAGPEVYGLGFVFVGGSYMLSNLVYVRLAARLGGDRMMIAGLICASLSGLAVFAAIKAGWTGLPTVFAAAVFNGLSAGLIVPNAMAGAVSAYPERAGAASSLLGFAQFAIAALVTQIGASLDHGSAAQMSLGMGALTTVGLAAYAALSGARQT
jgi:DHA1 family bicyclomycin/chloramphenicol resistance-like MFS transporter